MGYFCNECDRIISEEDYKYSKKIFLRPLCKKHQPAEEEDE